MGLGACHHSPAERPAGAPPGSGASPTPHWGSPPNSRGATPVPCASPAESAAPPPRWVGRQGPSPPLAPETTADRSPEAKAAGAKVSEAAGVGRHKRAPQAAANGPRSRSIAACASAGSTPRPTVPSAEAAGSRRVDPHLRAQPARRPRRGRRGPGAQVVRTFARGRSGVGPGQGGPSCGGGQGMFGARPYVQNAVAGRRHPATLNPRDRHCVPHRG